MQKLLGSSSYERVRSSHKAWVEEYLAGGVKNRQEKWTGSNAVGSKPFVERVKALLGFWKSVTSTQVMSRLLAARSIGKRPLDPVNLDLTRTEEKRSNISSERTRNNIFAFSQASKPRRSIQRWQKSGSEHNPQESQVFLDRDRHGNYNVCTDVLRRFFHEGTHCKDW